MSEERKKKSRAAWKAEEDEKLNKWRAFVELTEYIANEVENDTFLYTCWTSYYAVFVTNKGTHFAVPL